MNERNGYIAVEGLDKFFKQMERSSKEVQDAVLQGFDEFGANVIADAQINLGQNTSVVTGLLRKSGKVQRVNDGKSVEIGFFDTTNRNSGYALFVEYGRRAGKFPPVDELVQWARKKFRLDMRAAKSVGFLTARKIARSGSAPHPFFQPAVNKNISKLSEVIRKVLQRNEKYR